MLPSLFIVAPTGHRRGFAGRLGASVRNHRKSRKKTIVFDGDLGEKSLILQVGIGNITRSDPQPISMEGKDTVILGTRRHGKFCFYPLFLEYQAGGDLLPVEDRNFGAEGFWNESA
jgi:hypothetical protein